MQRQRPLGYYKWFWQDFRADRNVQRMDYVAKGLYRELLDECWVEGNLPVDHQSLADLCDCPVEVLANAWQMLSKCFLEIDGRLVSPLIESLRTEQDSLRVKRAASGKLGGVAKSSVVSADLASAKQTEANASKCHIEEKRREEKSTTSNVGKEVGKRVSRKAKVDGLDGYPEEALEVVKTLLPEWPRTAGDRNLAFDPNAAAARVTTLVQANPSLTPSLLIEAGRRYLRTMRESGSESYISALHFFFGPGKGSSMPKWEEQVRAVNFERSVNAAE